MTDIEIQDNTSTPPKPHSTTTPDSITSVPAAKDAVTSPVASGSPALLIVLQWLSYSLWIWVLIALSWLLSATLTYYFISKGDSYEHLLYVLAALVVLSPIALVLDMLYARREPRTKHGFAAVVLVLNAVVVFLAALGAVITAVVSALLVVFHPDSKTGATIAIVSSAVVATLALLFFVRMLNNPRLKLFNRAFAYIMTIVAVVSLVAAVAGPIRAEFRARNDRLIEQNLYMLASEIRDHAGEHRALPQNLQQVRVPDYQKEVTTLINSNKVEYRIVRQPVFAKNDTSSYPPYQPAQQAGQFELCVTYQAQRGNGQAPQSDSYNADLDTKDHPAGRVCYKQTTRGY